MAQATNSKDSVSQLDELRAVHGDNLAHVVVKGELHAFRCPTQDEFESYQARLGTEKIKGVCFRELCLQCCVTDVDKLRALFKIKPALATSIAGALNELAGLDIEVQVGKG